MRVVLPAPFGPNSPVTPWPIEKVADDSAVVLPKRLTTPSPAATLPTPGATAAMSDVAMGPTYRGGRVLAATAVGRRAKLRTPTPDPEEHP